MSDVGIQAANGVDVQPFVTSLETQAVNLERLLQKRFLRNPVTQSGNSKLSHGKLFRNAKHVQYMKSDLVNAKAALLCVLGTLSIIETYVTSHCEQGLKKRS